MKKFSIKVTDALLVLFSLFLCVGTAFLWDPCEAMKDGTWMRCHWAGVSVAGIGAALSVLAVVRLFVRDSGAKWGMSLAVVPFAVLAAIVPGVLIPLCGMKTMRCHAVTRPAVLIISILLVATAVIDLVIRQRRERRAGR